MFPFFRLTPAFDNYMENKVDEQLKNGVKLENKVLTDKSLAANVTVFLLKSRVCFLFCDDTS